MGLHSARTSDDGAIVELGWSDGTTARFHALWLRDNALDDKTRSATNGQRLVTILDLPPETSVKAVQLMAEGDLSLSFFPEQKTVAFPAEWLRARIYDRTGDTRQGWTPPKITRWQGGDLQVLPSASFATVASDRQALGRWLELSPDATASP